MIATLKTCLLFLLVRASNSQPQHQQAGANYDYYYYDEYIYDYPAEVSGPGGGGGGGVVATQKPAPKANKERRPALPASFAEDEELLGYDLDELLKAWKEYMKEKKVENDKEESTPPQESSKRHPSIPRGTGVRGTGIRGSGIRQGAGNRGTGFRQGVVVRGPLRRPVTGGRFRGGGRFQGSGQRFRPSGSGVRNNLKNRGSGFRGSGFRAQGVGIQGGSGNRGQESFPAYDYYDVVPEIVNPRRPSIVQYEEYECEPQDQSYMTPDEAQCDKFYECNIKGELKEKLCPDGLMFDSASQQCDYPAKVNCTGRPDLQPAQESNNCPRANGFFAWPAEESCQKFWDCRGGASYLRECPVGVIFDPKIDACVTPDQSARPECQAGKVLGFECPKYGDEEALRFGNHDRLPSPKNCQEFFTCLKTGQPRLGVCPKKTVFNKDTGNCGDPADVKGCENYWKDKEKDELADYYDY